ncbi:hypothetical protein [Candidatus Vidania fulgoroideorum]
MLKKSILKFVSYINNLKEIYFLFEKKNILFKKIFFFLKKLNLKFFFVKKPGFFTNFKFFKSKILKRKILIKIIEKSKKIEKQRIYKKYKNINYNLNKLPKVIFLADYNLNTIKEAKSLGIDIISFTKNFNKNIKYPIFIKNKIIFIEVLNKIINKCIK